MNWRFFTPEQRDALDAHLAGVLSEGVRLDALAALDWACAVARASLQPNREREIRDALSLRRRHCHDVAHHAEALAALLRTERPLWNTASIDWPALDNMLAAVVASARVEAPPAPRGSRRGRPSTTWRDQLIAVAFSVYPAGEAKKTAGSHFEQTVEMLLEFLNAEIADTHGLVRDALSRCPDPPYKVRARAVKGRNSTG
jgi:hypothetical protein